MKIDRKKLLEALNLACKVVDLRGNLPILSMVKIDGGTQSISATNLETSMVFPVPIRDYRKTSKVIVQAAVKADPVQEDILEGLSLDQMVALAADYGIPTPTVPKKTSKKKALEIMAAGIMDELEQAALKQGTPAVIEEKSFDEAFCLNAELLKKIIQSIDDEVVEIKPTSGAGGALFAAPSVSIGQNFQEMGTLDAADFPEFSSYNFQEDDEKFGKIIITSANLAKLIPAMTNDDTGFNLGVAAFFSKGQRAVSTDGHRLHMVPAVVKGNLFDDKKNQYVTLIKDAAVLLSKSEEKEIVFTTNGNVLLTHLGDAVISVRVPDTKFPDIDAVIPKSGNQKIVVERHALETTLKQALVISKEHKGIRFKFNGSIDVNYINPDLGSYQKMNVPIVKGGVEPEQEIGINGKYVLDIMGTALLKTDQFVLGVKGPADPVTFTQGDFFGLIMPMRI